MKKIILILLIIGMIFSFSIIFYLKYPRKISPSFKLVEVDINFDNITGSVNTLYGVQGIEHKGSVYYVGLREIQPSYIRQALVPHNLTTPLDFPASNWLWELIDPYIEAIVDIGAKPIMMINAAPPSMSIDNTFLNPPKNYSQFGDFAAKIVEHYKNLGYNISEWYWEIWNEPDGKPAWNVSEYVKMYNTVEKRMHEVDPTIKIGTAISWLREDWFLSIIQDVNSIQFLGWHQYGGGYTYSNDTLMRKTKELFEDPGDLINRNRKNYIKLQNIPTIISEINVGVDPVWHGDPRIQEEFNRAWYASALNHAIRGGINVTIYYRCCPLRVPGFGDFIGFEPMNETTKFPVFYTLQSFSKYVEYGSQVVESSSSDDMVEVLTIKNSRKIIVLINKYNKPVNIKLNITGSQGNLKDLDTGKIVSKSVLTLENYGVKFFEVIK